MEQIKISDVYNIIMFITTLFLSSYNAEKSTFFIYNLFYHTFFYLVSRKSKWTFPPVIKKEKRDCKVFSTLAGEKTFWSWLIQTNNIPELWERQPTFLLVQACYLFGALMTLLHACNAKGRWPLLWCCAISHGLFIEALCFFLPQDMADNYWHSQTPIMFFGGRLPVYIVFVYPCFYYQATVAVNKFRFSIWTQPFAVGLLVLLQDLPYDIVGVKFIHWTWHDTDPNIFDRHYWVPWNSFFFHVTFSASFTFWFHFARLRGSNYEAEGCRIRWRLGSPTSELFTFLVTSILGCVGGVLMFTLIYHPLQVLGIHSEVSFFLMFAGCCVVVWRAAMFGSAGERKRNLLGRDYFLLSHLIFHYSLFLVITMLAHPENEVSVGYHQPVGPCGETVQFPSASGKLLSKGKYLCVSDYDEGYFDFHCAAPPPAFSTWYTICGTPFSNRPEYIVITSSLTLLAAAVFGSIYLSQRRFESSTAPRIELIKAKSA